MNRPIGNVTKSSPQCACTASPKHAGRCKSKVLLSGTRCAVCRRECAAEGERAMSATHKEAACGDRAQEDEEVVAPDNDVEAIMRSAPALAARIGPDLADRQRLVDQGIVNIHWAAGATAEQIASAGRGLEASPEG